MANTFFIDYEGGNDANDGLSFANRKKTIAGVPAASSSPGDEFRLMACPGPHTLDVIATWTNNSNTISLSSNVNILLYDGGPAWTAATGDVTCTANQLGRRDQTLSCAQVAIATAFTTGLAAYYTLPAAVDCSAHSGLSLWYYPSIGQANAGNLSIRLCSDTVGSTPVNTIVLPRLNIANSWYPCYVETGSLFGSSIQSIALYVDVDTGPMNVLFQNINTVKPNTSNDNLNITSIIGKNSANDGWWPIRSINAATVYIDGGAKMLSTTGVVTGYSGNTESVSLVKYDPIQIANNLSSPITSSIACMTPNEAGNANNLYSFTGGWNRTDMSTQTGETFFDAMIGQGAMFGSNRSYSVFDKLHAARAYYGWNATLISGRIGSLYSIGCQSLGIVLVLQDSMANTLMSCASSDVGILMQLQPALIAGQTGGSNVNTAITLCSGSGLVGTTFIDGYSTQTPAGGEYNGKIGTIISKNSRGTGVMFYYATNGLSIDTIISCNNGDRGIYYSSVYTHALRINTCVLQNNRTYGIQLNSENMGASQFNYIDVSNNFTAGVYFSGGSKFAPRIVIGTLLANQFGTASCIRSDDWSFADAYILKSTLTGNTIVFGSTTTNLKFPGQIILRNYNGTAGDHRTYYHNNIAHIYASTEQRHTASGYSWKFAPRHTHYINEFVPLKRTIATIAVGASSLVTISVWVYRDNTGINGRLFVNGGQIGGVLNDVYVTTTGSAGAWEQLTTTFTPTETGVVEVQMRVWGGNTYNLWIDDFSMSQA